MNDNRDSNNKSIETTTEEKVVEQITYQQKDIERITSLIEEKVANQIKYQQKDIERVTSLAKDYQEELKKMRSLRAFCVGTLVSTIASLTGGWFAFDNYIKSQISTEVSKGVEALDRYTTAITQANSGDWNDSLGSLSGLWNRIEDKEISVSAQFKYNFYQNLLYVLSSMEQGVNGNFQGKEQWDRLMKDKNFHAYELQWSDDGNYHINKAMGLLKFSNDNNDVQEIGNRLEAAYRRSVSDPQRAYIAYNLGMYRTLLGETENAKKCFLEASFTDPVHFRVNDWKPYYGSFVNTPIFHAWSRLYNLRSQNKLDSVISNTMNNMMDNYPFLNDSAILEHKINIPRCVN